LVKEVADADADIRRSGGRVELRGAEAEAREGGVEKYFVIGIGFRFGSCV